jgi:hypothetical protein
MCDRYIEMSMTRYIKGSLAILFVKEAEKLYYFFIIKSLIGALIYSKFHTPNVTKITVFLYFTRIKYPSLFVKKYHPIPSK